MAILLGSLGAARLALRHRARGRAAHRIFLLFAFLAFLLLGAQQTLTPRAEPGCPDSAPRRSAGGFRC